MSISTRHRDATSDRHFTGALTAKMFFKNFAVATILLYISGVVDSGLEEDIRHRSRRQLLFPNSTLLQVRFLK